mmetsp:Transcript_136896/g.241895  ORF Transcript_136896/g.241895 Transcript_136896/m.241895 type:complete len:627 (-) Transcript_136896:225-2105(-)
MAHLLNTKKPGACVVRGGSAQSYHRDVTLEFFSGISVEYKAKQFMEGALFIMLPTTQTKSRLGHEQDKTLRIFSGLIANDLGSHPAWEHELNSHVNDRCAYGYESPNSSSNFSALTAEVAGPHSTEVLTCPGAWTLQIAGDSGTTAVNLLSKLVDIAILGDGWSAAPGSMILRKTVSLPGRQSWPETMGLRVALRGGIKDNDFHAVAEFLQRYGCISLDATMCYCEVSAPALAHAMSTCDAADSAVAARDQAIVKEYNNRAEKADPFVSLPPPSQQSMTLNSQSSQSVFSPNFLPRSAGNHSPSSEENATKVTRRMMKKSPNPNTADAQAATGVAVKDGRCQQPSQCQMTTDTTIKLFCKSMGALVEKAASEVQSSYLEKMPELVGKRSFLELASMKEAAQKVSTYIAFQPEVLTKALQTKDGLTSLVEEFFGFLVAVAKVCGGARCTEMVLEAAAFLRFYELEDIGRKCADMAGFNWPPQEATNAAKYRVGKDSRAMLLQSSMETLVPLLTNMFELSVKSVTALQDKAIKEEDWAGAHKTAEHLAELLQFDIQTLVQALEKSQSDTEIRDNLAIGFRIVKSGLDAAARQECDNALAEACTQADVELQGIKDVSESTPATKKIRTR